MSIFYYQIHNHCRKNPNYYHRIDNAILIKHSVCAEISILSENWPVLTKKQTIFGRNYTNYISLVNKNAIFAKNNLTCTKNAKFDLKLPISYHEIPN